MQVSEGGILIRTPATLRKGEIIIIHFMISTRYIRAEGEVLYLLPQEKKTPALRIGIGFKKITEAEQSWIRQYTGPLK